jgi:hypothetical protein
MTEREKQDAANAEALLRTQSALVTERRRADALSDMVDELWYVINELGDDSATFRVKVAELRAEYLYREEPDPEAGDCMGCTARECAVCYLAQPTTEEKS